MKHTSTIISVALLFALAGCRKKVHKVNEDWIGNWFGGGRSSCPATLSIDENSDGYFSMDRRAECAWSTEGAVRIGQDNLKIKVYRFKIIEHPTRLDNPFSYLWWTQDTFQMNWRMKIKCANMYCSTGELTLYRE